MVAMDGLDNFSGDPQGCGEVEQRMEQLPGAKLEGSRPPCRIRSIDGAHQPRPQLQILVVRAEWTRKTGHLHLGNGGYGWTRTTDLSIMSAAL